MAGHSSGYERQIISVQSCVYRGFGSQFTAAQHGYLLRMAELISNTINAHTRSQCVRLAKLLLPHWLITPDTALHARGIVSHRIKK